MQSNKYHRRMSLTTLLVPEEPSKQQVNTMAISKSVKDRRIRNKTASAKYRAKKTIQHREMQKTIQELVQQNIFLRKQLEQYQDVPASCAGVANSTHKTDHLLSTFNYTDKSIAYSTTDDLMLKSVH